jgi:hypothetical protein
LARSFLKASRTGVQKVGKGDLNIDFVVLYAGGAQRLIELASLL